MNQIQEKHFEPALERGPMEARLNVFVIFTSVHSTMLALQQAGKLADSLGARITLLVPQVVSYELPLNRPPVSVDWTERRFRVMADQYPVETSVKIYLCRDRFEAVRRVLAPHSLVVMGGKKRWWWPASWESRFARILRQSGHEVIFVRS